MILQLRVLVAIIVPIAGVLIAARATAEARVAVLPTLPPPGLHVAVPGLPGAIDSLIHLQLTQSGVAVVGLDTCRTATRAALDSVGGVFDRRTGHVDSSRVERARALTRESLAQGAGADLFLESALVFALAREQSGTATWDDMRIQVREQTMADLFSSRQSGVRALSLRVTVRDRQGRVIADRQAGLRMLVRRNKDGYEPIPTTEWLGDPDATRSAVERALHPLLLLLFQEGGQPPAPGAPMDSMTTRIRDG